LSLLLSSVLAKKWHHKESDGKTGFALDDIKNERQLSKKSFYSEKHFKYLSEEELHKMAKLSPISVSEEDIRLQADIDDIDLKPDTSAHNSQKLPNIRDSTQPKLVKDKSASIQMSNKIQINLKTNTKDISIRYIKSMNL